MKLGFICPNLPGHLNPMTALARELQARGHDVLFLYSSDAAGLPFIPDPEKDHVNENRGQTSKMQGEDAKASGKANGLSVAADLVEQSLGLSKKTCEA
jgi:zeaxanthin glucosyltransferase